MSLTKHDLVRPQREKVSLEPLGIAGSVSVRSLTAAARVAFLERHTKDNQLTAGAREALLLEVVEQPLPVAEGQGWSAVEYEPLFATIDEVATMRPDVQEVLFEVAARLSVLREADRQAVKKACSVAPSGALPTTSPSSSGARQ